MKIRPVTCIHIAAYLFSALVLGVSGVSYYYKSDIGWDGGGSRVRLFSSNGRFTLVQVGPWWEYEKSFSFSMLRNDVPLGEDRDPYGHPEIQFLGMKFVKLKMSFLSADPLWMDPSRFWIVPCANLLVLPLTWMSGFHLFRLWRRWRTERNVQRLMPAESANSD